MARQGGDGEGSTLADSRRLLEDEPEVKMAKVTLDQAGIADIIKQVCAENASTQSEVVRQAVRDEMEGVRKEIGDVRQEVRNVDGRVGGLEDRILVTAPGLMAVAP